MKKKWMAFEKWVSQSILTWLITFKALPKQLQYKPHRIPPKVGKEGVYILFGSNLVYFRGL
jgi:hypothetical protein